MKRSGFSLIEIIFALVIVSALMTVSFSALYTMLKKAEIEATISNVAEAVISLIHQSRMESAKKEIYIELNYKVDKNTLSYTMNSNTKYYQLPEQYVLEPLESTEGIPFSGSPKKTGFYLGYFVEEDTDSMSIKYDYTFLVQSLVNTDIIREVCIYKGLPLIVGE